MLGEDEGGTLTPLSMTPDGTEHRGGLRFGAALSLPLWKCKELQLKCWGMGGKCWGSVGEVLGKCWESVGEVLGKCCTHATQTRLHIIA